MLNLTYNRDPTGCTVAEHARNNFAWDTVALSSKGCSRTQHSNGSGIEGRSNSDRNAGNSRNTCTNTSVNNAWAREFFPHQHRQVSSIVCTSLSMPGVGFDSRAGQIGHSVNDSMFLRSSVARALSRGDVPPHATRHTLRRNTTNVMKISTHRSSRLEPYL